MNIKLCALAQHGTPDCNTNFNCGKAGQKRKNESSKTNSVEEKTFTFIPNPQPQVMGKRVKVMFMVNNLKKEEFFVGVISSYSGLKCEYGIYF